MLNSWKRIILRCCNFCSDLNNSKDCIAGEINEFRCKNDITAFISEQTTVNCGANGWRYRPGQHNYFPHCRCAWGYKGDRCQVRIKSSETGPPFFKHVKSHWHHMSGKLFPTPLYVQQSFNPTKRLHQRSVLLALCQGNPWVVSRHKGSVIRKVGLATGPLSPSNWSALYRGHGSPVMSGILLKANNGQQASGVGDKRFFRFKRNVQHLWTAIIRRHLNDITHQQFMRFNHWSKFANIF